MKCIHCESDTKFKDRNSNGGRCARCSHRFAFEPTTDPHKVTDGLFLRCIKDVSGDNTLFFTEKQLWYEFNRRLLRKIAYIPPPFGIGAGVCAAGGFVGMLAGVAFLLPVGLVAGAAALIIGVQVGKKNPRPRRVILRLEDFRSRYLQTYRGTHGRIEKLLPEIKPSSRGRNTSDVAPPPDLASYSFDRALVTQDAETAAMLVANRFHFENNCAIVSQDRRYPENGRFEMILEMLKQNPALTVFTLHDASATGTGLPAALRSGNWFPNHTVRIADLGLRPLHAMKGGFVLNDEKPLQPSPGLATRLSPEETAWLAQGNIAEIAALRPARLMRAIYQGFNRVNAMPAGQSDSGGVDGVIIVGGPHYGGDVWADGGTGADVFAADSFG